ncbi:MAG: hypothetical protein MK106_01880 [Mariniblastus sp.]|nr:hypothetical protein [Mariniblastus sp.]
MPTSRPEMTGSGPAVRGVDVHAVHKSATMFLYQFFGRLSEKQGFDFYSENNSPANQSGLSIDNQRDFCRCPIRSFEVLKTELDHPTQIYRIFHIRDPRDILVSEYFSFGWIHPTEGTGLEAARQERQEIPIDEYVLTQCEKRTWPLEAKFKILLDRDIDPEYDIIVTYETMVTQFRLWAERVLPAFGVRYPRVAALQWAWRYRKEFQRTGESMTHKRRITPGDHRIKLKPATIDQLNQRFETILTRFNYSF